MKTFKDLNFKPHSLFGDTETYSNAKQAIMNFDNGYGVSVLIGKYFYSDGISTYELAILHNNEICYETPITNDVLGYLSEKEVTEVMKKIQQL